MKSPNKNNNLFSFIPVFIMLLSISLLSACGGGGGDASSGPTISVSAATVVEGDAGTVDMVFNVSISPATTSATSVSYATSDGTAYAASDYTATSGTLNIASGSSSATITVTVNADTDFEFAETLILTLSNASGLTLGTSSATGTITDDDDADPQGYYTGSVSVDTGPIIISDMIGLASNGRLLMFSRTGSNNVLYDIDLTTITGTDFSGTAKVYIDGSISQTSVAVAGTTNESQITGAISGSGLADGTFDILFNTNNNEVATQTRIEADNNPDLWAGTVYDQNSGTARFLVLGDGAYTGIDDSIPTCQYSGSFIFPYDQGSIYPLNHGVISPFAGANCTYVDTGYTGFAAVISDGSLDNTLVYAFSNGAVSLFAIMTK